ncbi:hypothetical protein [Microbacterium pumilum]|uniref:Uncharacterized protein n=1 Tax=Microbacterium pumilum TaxID=344165 RepID=A0ABN2S730_9MICO
MKLLTNSSGAYLTGDDIANAVLGYGAALANEQRVDLVDVPYIAEHGRVGSVRLIVGWHATMNAEVHQGQGVELLDGATLAELRKRVAALNPSGDTPLASDEISYLARVEEF